MKIQKQIKVWQKDGIITAKQARQMTDSLQGEGKSRAVQILSVIGAVCVAIGVISVISSNWGMMADWLRITLLSTITIATLYTGYFLQFQKKNYPRTGKSLIFLSSAFFATTVFLIAQIFNISTEYNFVLVGIILAGIAPIVYGLRSTATAYLFAAALMTWLLMTIDYFVEYEGIKRFLFFALSFSIAGLGSLQKQFKGFEAIANAYRLVSLVVIAGFSFILTIEDAFEGILYKIDQDIFATLLFAGLASLPLLLAYRKNHNLFDFKLAIFAITLFGLLFVNNPIVYNVVYLLTLLSMLYTGARENNQIAIHSLSILLFVYLFAKYIEIFHDAFDGGVFFISCGTILIVGSVFLEKKLRSIRKQAITSKS